jgi:hypothetical protein
LSIDSIILNESDDFVSAPRDILVGIKIKTTNRKVFEFFWRPPSVLNWLDDFPCTNEYFLRHLINSRLTFHWQRNVQSTGISADKLERSLRWFLQRKRDSILVLLQGDDIHEVNPANEAACQVSLRERWHVFTTVLLVKLSVNSFQVFYLLGRWFLLGCVYPQRTSILVGPVSSFEPLKALDKQRCPGLVHGQTHSDVVLLPVELLVWPESFLLLLLL